jgi:hypothetical protein
MRLRHENEQTIDDGGLNFETAFFDRNDVILAVALKSDEI